MGWDFETINATVSLEEDPSGKFYLEESYQATGVKDISGPFGPEGPITGDNSGSQSVGEGITLYYAINNWNETSTTVSMNLTVYLEGDGMEPDYLFNNQLYSGNK